MKTTARPTGRPVIPLGIEDDTEHVLVRSDGQVRGAVRVIYDDYDVGRMKAGYICANCIEDLDTAFPDECPICKFPMKERQAEYIAKAYTGSVHVGPSTSLEDEYALMDEFGEKLRRESRDEILRPTQVLLPGRDFTI